MKTELCVFAVVFKNIDRIPSPEFSGLIFMLISVGDRQ